MLTDYLKHFQSKVEVLKHFSGKICQDPKFLPEDVKGSVSDFLKLAKMLHGYTLALSLLKHADPVHFGTLWHDLENQYSRSNNQPISCQPHCSVQHARQLQTTQTGAYNA